MADEQIPTWAKKLIEDTNQLAVRIQELKGGDANSITKNRLEKLSDTLEKIELPFPSLKIGIIRQFNRMKFKDEGDFEEYVNDITEAYPLKEDNEDKQASKEELNEIINDVMPGGSSNKTDNKSAENKSGVNDVLNLIFPG